jgi:hypothetical protein
MSGGVMHDGDGEALVRLGRLRMPLRSKRLRALFTRKTVIPLLTARLRRYGLCSTSTPSAGVFS